MTTPFWRMTYENDEDAEVETLHATEESAQRDACRHILSYGLKTWDLSAPGGLEVATKFLSHVEHGDYERALVFYQKVAEDDGNGEIISVDQDDLLESADIPLLEATTRARAKVDTRDSAPVPTPGKEEDEDAETEEEEEEEEEDEGDE